jgi:hypothetical protein
VHYTRRRRRGKMIHGVTVWGSFEMRWYGDIVGMKIETRRSSIEVLEHVATSLSCEQLTPHSDLNGRSSELPKSCHYTIIPLWFNKCLHNTGSTLSNTPRRQQ